MSIKINGNPCGCGLRGCLATYLTTWALELRAKELLPLYSESNLNSTNPNIRFIEKAALEGDELALRIVKEASEYLSIAITSINNLVNPSMIIVGGSLTRLGDLLLKPIQEKVEKTNLVPNISPTQITMSNLGTQAIAIGAATLALEETFLEPNFLNNRLHAGLVK
jgi:predicted NBD/HSP70 family sugar kinase